MNVVNMTVCKKVKAKPRVKSKMIPTHTYYNSKPSTVLFKLNF